MEDLSTKDGGMCPFRVHPRPRARVRTTSSVSDLGDGTVRRRTDDRRDLGTESTRGHVQRTSHHQTRRSQRRHRDIDHAHAQSYGHGAQLAGLDRFDFPPQAAVSSFHPTFLNVHA